MIFNKLDVLMCKNSFLKFYFLTLSKISILLCRYIGYAKMNNIINRRKQVLDIAETQGVINAKGIESVGISRNHIYSRLKKVGCGVSIKVYSPEKTLADCFKFRVKVGLDYAIEGIKEVLRFKKATPYEIMLAVEVNCVAKIIQPYLAGVI